MLILIKNFKFRGFPYHYKVFFDERNTPFANEGIVFSKPETLSKMNERGNSKKL